MAIGRSDVVRAANALTREGLKASSKNVLAHLGEGSLSTITKYLKEYIAEVEREVEASARKQDFKPEMLMGDLAKLFRSMDKRISQLEKDVKQLKSREMMVHDNA